ncbi:hypothetical protein TRVA0_054S00276 [Trichomonascus vanleenenianus]|uniref:uncharacterized protein n=1 Tax=Trichomonascus vanleenenianus TaxID=2268995 RepID=UPI003ECB4FF5
MSCSFFFVPYKVDYRLYVQAKGTGVSDNSRELLGGPWLSNNQYFTGGSTVLFEAGEVSPEGIKPNVMSPEQVQNVFEGDWGVEGIIYEYEYNVIPIDWYRYEVDCYCMDNSDCTCDRVVGDEDYFIDLIASRTPNIQVIKNGRNTHVAMNGTYDSVMFDDYYEDAEMDDEDGRHIADYEDERKTDGGNYGDERITDGGDYEDGRFADGGTKYHEHKGMTDGNKYHGHKGRTDGEKYYEDKGMKDGKKYYEDKGMTDGKKHNKDKSKMDGDYEENMMDGGIDEANMVDGGIDEDRDIIDGNYEDPYYYDEDDAYFQEDEMYYDCYEDDCYDDSQETDGYYEGGAYGPHLRDDYYFSQHKPVVKMMPRKRFNSAGASIRPMYWLVVLSTFLSLLLSLTTA